jgi:CheY-like chemotaxis protein
MKNFSYLDVAAYRFIVDIGTTERGFSMPSNPATTESLPNLFGLHVLVIEDDEDARQLLADVFQFAGATVTACRDAYTGLDNLDERRPDVIVCDLALPRMDGLAFLRALRAHPSPETRRTPMIAVTAYYELYGPNELCAMGCEAYMAKPLSLDRICEAVGRLGFLAARRGEKYKAS